VKPMMHHPTAATAAETADSAAVPTGAPGDDRANLRIGGLTPLTTVDYPGELAAVVFCQGCPWRCRYCHNGHLLDSHAATSVAWAEVMAFLRRRHGLLDAVVFSGGEPTAQHALRAAVDQVRALGFKVGLHTAGSYPKRLSGLLPYLDWVGLDIKALPQDYAGLTGTPGSGERAWTSLEVLRQGEVPFEVRITVHDTLLPPERQQRLLDRLKQMGITRPRLQPCHTEHALDPTLATA
jgi:pyruvate formate lyase activating enzyme